MLRGIEDTVNGAFLVHGIRVETRLNRIQAAGGTVQVEPKIMQVLVRLAQSPGEVVSKDELIETVWPDTSATDDVLARAISELRKAFGDDARQPRVIETIRKGGYRLLAPVSEADQGWTQPRHLRRLAATALLLAIAVAGVWMLQGPAPGPQPRAETRSLPLTSFKGVERDPAISPDGNLVAFSWNGPNQDNWDIYVKLRGEETPQRLTQSPFEDASPAWSPDGERIAFRRRDGDECDLMVVPAIGGVERPLAECQENAFADLVWSPDGRWLAHNDTTEPGLHAIIRVDAETGVGSPLTRPPNGIWGDYDPSFSFDGGQLAFARALSEGIQDVYVVDLDSGEERRVTRDNRNIYGLAWTPAGEILFASNRRGDYDLWRIAPVGGEPALVLAGEGSLVNPTLDRSGETLVYEHRRYDMDIQRFELAPGPGQPNPVRVASSTRWELYPAISTSGRQIAFASNRSGGYEIWISDVDGASPRMLTRFGGPLTSAPSWSPDDSRIVFDARPDGHADIYVVDPVGGRPQRLTEDPADDVAPSWSLDGEWIYFGSNRTGNWQIWRMAADGTGVRQVTENGGFRALDTSRGLYYTRFGEPGLWAAEERRFPFPSPVDWGNWQAGEEGIYRVDRSAGPPYVVLHRWSGESETLFQAPGVIPPSDGALAVSRDGKTILYGQVVDRWVDLIVVTSPEL